MSTYGKVCAWLVVPSLMAAFYLTVRTGQIHNAWSAKLSAAHETAETTGRQHRAQKRELATAENVLARAQFGWDKSWQISNTGNQQLVAQNEGLLVTGLGSDQGLIPVVYIDDAGQTRTQAPTVHTFRAMPEGVMYYVGEFIVGMQQNQIPPNNVALIPTWQTTSNDRKMWRENPQGGWRFRTLIPASHRARIDQLNVQINRLVEQYADVDVNVLQQQELLNEANDQLTIRKQELLGNPDTEPTPGRPEFHAGLLTTIRSEEDQRNSLLVEVDSFRREIRRTAEEREKRIETLKELSSRLPSGDGQPRLTQEEEGSVR